MKAIIFLFVLLITTFSFGQLRQRVGQILLTDSLSQLEIKDNNFLDISINKLWCHYAVKTDTLILKSNEKFENGNYFDSFKILTNTIDSLFLIPIISSNQHKFLLKDTLKFISVKKRITTLKDFNYLRIDEYGTWGSKRLIINKDKTVEFSNKGNFLPDEPATDVKHFSLSAKEYSQVIDTLTVSLFLMIENSKKAKEVYDPTSIDISYDINGKKRNLQNIEISRFHYKLYKFLTDEIFNNK